jgi:hypothetical protein
MNKCLNELNFARFAQLCLARRTRFCVLVITAPKKAYGIFRTLPAGWRLGCVTRPTLQWGSEEAESLGPSFGGQVQGHGPWEELQPC